MLEHMLNHFNIFSQEGKQAFFSDMEFLSADRRLCREFLEGGSLLDAIFSLAKYPEAEISLSNLYLELLFHMLAEPDSSAALSRICAKLNGSPLFRLRLVDCTLQLYFERNVKSEARNLGGFLHVLFAVEDAVMADPSIISHVLTRKLLCKLLYLLNMHNMLYVSWPVMAQFDERGAGEGNISNCRNF